MMTVPFEERPCKIQTLSFSGINKILDSSASRTMITLDRLRSDGRFINHALMISDQCPWHIRMVFGAQDVSLEGSLPVQLTDCLRNIKQAIPMISVPNRVGRYRRIPSKATQEAIVNAVIHFDPESGKEIVVNMDADLITVTSPGGVFIPDTWADITRTGARNARMADLLVAMGYAQLKGRGFGIIKECYCSTGVIPCLVKGENSFTVRLPPLDTRARDSKDVKKAVLEYIRVHRNPRMNEISSGTMLSPHIVKKVLKEMEEKGEVFIMGSGNDRRVFTNDTSETERIALPGTLV